MGYDAKTGESNEKQQSKEDATEVNDPWVSIGC